MRYRRIGFVIVLFGFAALPLRAHAVTRDVVSQYGSDIWTWQPSGIHVTAGDTIRWTINPGCTSNCVTHRILQYAGKVNGAVFDSGDMTTGTFTQPFTDGSVWYRCKYHSLAYFGILCDNRMCGGYTQLTSASTPVVAAPGEGTSVSTNAVAVSGTADPYTLITIREGVSDIGWVMSNASGSWSTTLGMQKGAHSLVITARTAAGDTAQTTRSFTVVSDAQPPQLAWTTRPPGPVIDKNIYGTVADESGTASIRFSVWRLNQVLFSNRLADCPTCATPGAQAPWTIHLNTLQLLPGAYAINVFGCDLNQICTPSSSPLTGTFVIV